MKTKSGVYSIYWLFAVVYAFMKGSIGWGILNIFLPIAPLIDLVKYLSK